MALSDRSPAAAGRSADDELAFAGAARQAELVRTREASSRELTELSLRRIERLDPQLRAFRVVLAERALAEADQADARRGAGDERPLLGVPVAVKDVFDVAGEQTPNGTAAAGGPVAADSEVVRRLRSAGAVVVGKTHVPELCIWPFTETLTFGVTCNPWSPEHSPGGSSGGSGAAVAAGLVGAALASDGAGSIRIPASCCGLFGLKPQRGRVPLAPHEDHWHGLSTAGALTRSVRDSALLYDALCDRDDGAGSFSAAATAAPERLRIAVSYAIPRTWPWARLGEDQRRATEQTAELLRTLGHEVAEADPDYGQVTNEVTVRYLRGVADDAAAMPHPERLERRTRSFARLGGLIPDSLLARVRAAEAGSAARIGRLFDGHDVLLTPALARPPLRVGAYDGRGAIATLMGAIALTPYTSIWNLTGQPAAAVPAGLDGGGLPLAVQLVGRRDGEPTLLSLAAQIEAERPWADRRPPIS